MAQVEEKARSMDIRTLCLRVRKDNERAVRLYRRMGYSTSEETPDFLLMNKILV